MSSKPHPSLLEGERLALTCVANEATKEIKWTKDNVSEITRASTREIGKNSTLVIEKVLTSDSGNYSCMAVNNAGSASSSVYINVTGIKKKCNKVNTVNISKWFNCSVTEELLFEPS